MSSPFPGMNPYLEIDDAWHEFHEIFCVQCLEMLAKQVRPKYIVKMDRNVYIHEFSAEERRLVGRGDVFVTRQTPAEDKKSATATLDAPALGRVPMAVDILEETFLKVLDRDSRQIVTIIELLSPSNKYAGEDRDQYVHKRQRLLAGRAHFVEIDLLRGGPRMPIEDLPECCYYAMVSRCEDRPRVALWPIALRDRLPDLPIPLLDGDPNARLDLQEILHKVYDVAAFEDYIYQKTLQPQLPEPDASWASEIVRQRLQ